MGIKIDLKILLFGHRSCLLVSLGSIALLQPKLLTCLCFYMLQQFLRLSRVEK